MKFENRNPIAILQSSYNTHLTHPTFFYPRIIIIFIQLLFLKVSLHYSYKFMSVAKWVNNIQILLDVEEIFKA